MSSKGKILFLQEFSLSRQGGGVSILRRVMQFAGKYQFDVQSGFDRSSNKGIDPSALHELTFSTLPRHFRFGLGRFAGWLTLSCLDLFAIISLTRLIRKAGASIVHLTAHDVCFPVMALAARRLKIPVVVSVHDLWHITVRAYIPESMAHRIFKRSLTGVDTVYVISEEMAEYLSSKYGPKNYQIIHDGIEVNQLEATASVEAIKPPSFLYVGVLHPMQRQMFQLFIESLNRFTQDQFNIGICSNTHFELEKPQQNITLTNYGWVNETSLKQISKSFTYGLLPLSFQPSDHLFYKTSLMTKIPFYIKAGLPILCMGPADSSAVRTIRKLNLGTCLTGEGAGDLNTFSGNLLSDHISKYRGYQEGLRTAANTVFNIELIVERFYSSLPVKNHLNNAR